MSVQSRIGTFGPGQGPAAKRPPERFDDDELEHHIAPNCIYDFDVDQVNGIHKLRQRIHETVFADDPAEKWSWILGDHFTMGNKKVAKEVAIYNFGGAAHDCLNLGTEHCQVDAANCYAVRTEDNYPHPLDARRRELIIWDHLDPQTFADAFRHWHGRKRNEVTALRLNESGDFRHRHDLFKVDQVARLLDDIVDVYTYSSSDWLPWHKIDHIVVNRSNQRKDFGARRFEVVDDVSDIPDGGIRCPHDVSDGEIKCGSCRLCLEEDAGDVYVKNFYADEE
ncbi:GP88 family protein (plasmid) [Haloplanus ruber]|uniref:Gene product 88 domain-containing protein n=1 Tax=Haloplanus ruber TaxID=869892 RepID=A0ABD6D2H0_9EURY|nr:hypothetical protein [Haloplanus ruber]